MEQSRKRFKIPGDQIRDLIPNRGACYASDRITVDGCKVGYMYREEPEHTSDSGWRFFSEDETEAYLNDADNFGIYEVNTLCNYDPAIIPHLEAPPGTAFARVAESDRFEEEGFQSGDE